MMSEKKRSLSRRAGRLRGLGVAVVAIATGLAAAFGAGAPAFASGTSYYVGVYGSDSNSGTSVWTPFRTIQKCATVALAGDTCNITAGTYRETVTPANSGTATAPITFQKYGTGDVTVSGTDLVNGWHQVDSTDLAALAVTDPYISTSGFASGVSAGAIYSVSVTANSGLQGNQVFDSGSSLVQAQWPWPGTDPLNPTVEMAQSGSTTTTIVDSALTQPTNYWAGASVYTNYWFWSQTNTVSSSASGSLTLASALTGQYPGTNSRYYLYGMLRLLSHAGSWFYDSTNHLLYVWTASGSAPATDEIELKQRTSAFNLASRSYITVDGLGLYGANINSNSSSVGLTIDSIDAQYVSPEYRSFNYIAGDRDSGIMLMGTQSTIKNSTISHSGGNGITLFGSYNTATNNVIEDVDTMGTYAAGVNVGGNHQSVTHNTITRVGRSGIATAAFGGVPSQYNTFSYNDISSHAMLNVDTGAIYACCSLNMVGTSIDHNWLHDASPWSGALHTLTVGVYLDNASGGATVANNVGWNLSPWTPSNSRVVVLNATSATGVASYVYNNDGGVSSANQPSGAVIENNIGFVTLIGTNTGVTVSNNLDATVTDPLYTDPSTNDYTLQSGSPARNAAVPITGITDGSTDPTPSQGAYQYGATAWTPGAS